MNIKRGFTLAEVLITLTVIGVVAALTIPSLINNLGDKQTNVAWHKVFGDLNQAFIRYTVNYGNPNSSFTSDGQFAAAFGNFMNYVKICQTGATTNNACYPTNGPVSFDGKSVVATPAGVGGLVLGNGAMLDFYATGQSFNSGALVDVGTIYVDTNGVNPPNRIGKDVYAVHLTPTALVAYGGKSDGQDCSTTGWGCSAYNLYN